MYYEGRLTLLILILTKRFEAIESITILICAAYELQSISENPAVHLVVHPIGLLLACMTLDEIKVAQIIITRMSYNTIFFQK